MYNPYSERSVLGKLFDQPAKRNVPHIHNEHNEIDQHISFIANRYGISVADVELLGEGGFGQVFKVNSNNLAVKVMKKSSLAKKELRRSFNHENLLKHSQHYSSDTHYYLESECLECNLWEERAKQNSIPKDSHIWQLTYQVACGLTEMHRNNVIHRDIKLQNILLRSGSSFKVVLGDYGLAKCQETCDFVSTSGTPGFVDPALKKGSNSFDFSYDIYSFGKTLIQFILGNKFRYQYSDEMLETLIKNNKNNVSQEISELIHRMIDRNLNQRIKLDEILSISKQHVAREPKISEMFL